MRAQSFLYLVRSEQIVHRRVKHPVTVRVLTHINKSRPGRRIRNEESKPS